MRRKDTFLALLLILLVGNISAQDVNFSQFFNNPVYLNPGLTGNTTCKFRLGLNYKSQFRTISQPYVTINAFADGKLKDNPAKGDVLGGGVIVYNDNAGIGNLSTTKALVSSAYHKMLSKGKTSQYLSLGVSAGIVQKTLDGGVFTWNTQWTSEGFDKGINPGEPGLNNGQFPNVSFLDLNAGVVYSISTDDNIGMQGGFSLGNILGVKETFLEDQENTRGRKPTIFFNGFFGVSDEITVMPGFMYTNQRGANELVIGSNISFQVDKSDFYLVGGLWARNLRDISPSIGFESKGISMLLNYDFNITPDLSVAAQSRRGIELSIIYSPVCKDPKQGKHVPFLRFSK